MGLGIPLAPQAIVGECQCLANASPAHVFASLDVENAFGNVRRAPLLANLVQLAPELARFLLLLWGFACGAVVCASRTRVFMRGLAGRRWCFELLDGLYQGEALSSMAFCIALHAALMSVQAQLPSGSRLFAYIDDILLAIALIHLSSVMQLIRSALESIGLTLKSEKCRAWVPAAPESYSEPELAKASCKQVWGARHSRNGSRR